MKIQNKAVITVVNQLLDEGYETVYVNEKEEVFTEESYAKHAGLTYEKVSAQIVSEGEEKKDEVVKVEIGKSKTQVKV